MAFYGYREDFDRCYSTPYASSDYSSPYVSGEPQLIEYKPPAYCTNDSFVTPSEFNYSAYTYSEPQVLHYDPIEYHTCYNYYESYANPSEINYIHPKFLQYDPRGYFPSETKFTISYSTVEFNEPEFEEYDPTPYDGGYDPVTTYGKPLPPSDAICYPREVPQSDSIPLDNFAYSSIPSPYGKDDDLPTKPPTGSKPVETENHVEKGDKVTSDGKDVETVGPGVILENGHQNGFESGYESERQMHQIPYGSGLESIDLCESIFGYWPCLAKIEREKKNKCRFCDQERRIDPWESAANYLFGSPVVYDFENYHHQHNHVHNSWLQ